MTVPEVVRGGDEGGGGNEGEAGGGKKESAFPVMLPQGEVEKWVFLQQGIDGRMDPALLNHAVLSALGSDSTPKITNLTLNIPNSTLKITNVTLNATNSTLETTQKCVTYTVCSGRVPREKTEHGPCAPQLRRPLRPRVRPLPALQRPHVFCIYTILYLIQCSAFRYVFMIKKVRTRARPARLIRAGFAHTKIVGGCLVTRCCRPCRVEWRADDSNK